MTETQEAPAVEEVEQEVASTEVDAYAEPEEMQSTDAHPSITEEQLARLEHMEEVQDQRRIVRESLVEYNRAKEHASARKKRYEADVADLHQLIDEDPTQRKLFSPSTLATSGESDNCDADTDEAWKSFDIHNLQKHGVSEKQCEKLSAANIESLGDLQELMTARGTFWAKDVSGIGGAAQTKVEDAFNALVCQVSAVSDEDEGSDGEESPDAAEVEGTAADASKAEPEYEDVDDDI